MTSLFIFIIFERSRWDETPTTDSSSASGSVSQTPSQTPYGMSALNAMTPMTSTYNLNSMTPEQQQHLRWEAEVDERNHPMSDVELDALFPPGYKILDPPASYVPLRTPSRKLLTTPTPLAGTPGFSIMPTPARETYAVPPTPSESALPFIKQEDYQYFGKLLDDSVSEELLDESEQKERKIMR